MSKTANTPERWDTHWSRFSLSTRANPGHVLRRRLITRLLGPTAAESGTAILDFGCGSGDLLAMLSRRFPAAVVAGVILGFFVRSYVELVRVVIDMLMPQ